MADGSFSLLNLDLSIDLLILDVINQFIFGHGVVIYYLVVFVFKNTFTILNLITLDS